MNLLITIEFRALSMMYDMEIGTRTPLYSLKLLDSLQYWKELQYSIGILNLIFVNRYIDIDKYILWPQEVQSTPEYLVLIPRLDSYSY